MGKLRSAKSRKKIGARNANVTKDDGEMPHVLTPGADDQESTHLSSRRRFLRDSAVFATAFAGSFPIFGFPSAVAQRSKKALIVATVAEPPTLASYLNPNDATSIVATKIYEGLLSYNFSLQPEPRLAKSWKVSADGKTMTFELERNVKFHDGKPFTSADVQYTMMEVLKKHHPRGRLTYKSIETAEVPDSHTVVFKLSEPAPYLLRAFSGFDAPMLPKHLLEGKEIMGNPLGNKPVGTGPFRFVEWQKGQYIRLERNPQYWKKGLPHLDQIAFRTITDSATRAAALEKGEIHYIGQVGGVPNIDAQRLKALPNVQLSSKGYEAINPLFQMEVNTTRKPLDNQKVRQALAYAIDRKFMAEEIFYGNGKVATGPIHSNLAGLGLYTTEGVRNYGVPNAVEIANSLLDEAGHKKGPDGTRFTITLNAAAYGSDAQRSAEYVQQAFQKIGVKLILNFEDFGTWMRRIFTNYDFDLMMENIYGHPDPVIGVHRSFHSKAISKGTPWVNVHRWSSPKTDALMDAAAVELDPKKRAALYHEFQREVVEACPIIQLLEPHYQNAQSSAFKDIIVDAHGPSSTFEQARPA